MEMINSHQMNTKKIVESASAVFVAHLSSESKDCKLHKIVASQGSINIDNSVKFPNYFLLLEQHRDDLSVVVPAERHREFSVANVGFSEEQTRSASLQHFLRFCHLSK